jgi:WASH complex subunit strumpellin
MESYLVGVIEVNPKQILEEGIKKELIKLVAKILDDELVFTVHTVEEFEKRLKTLGSKI